MAGSINIVPSVATTVDGDAAKLAEIQIYCSSATEPVLTDAELTHLVAVYTASGKYAALRAGWEIKAAKCAGSYKFSDNGQSFDKQAIHDHCIKQMNLYPKYLSTSSAISNIASDAELEATNLYDGVNPDNYFTATAEDDE